MLNSNLADLLAQTVDAVTHAGELLVAEWGRVGGPRGEGDKAEVDMEIEAVLRSQLLGLLCCDFWGEETGHMRSWSAASCCGSESLTGTRGSPMIWCSVLTGWL